MKKLFVLIATILAASSMFLMTSCSKNFKFDDQYFVGIQEHIYEIRAMEPSVNIDYVADMVKFFGIKVFRLNVTEESLFWVDTNDQVKFNTSKKNTMREVIDALMEAGVERIVYSTDTFIFPYGYKSTHSKAVPNPYNEKEAYVRFLEVNAKAYGLIAQEFPEIDYFELINEPDIPNNECIVKNGMQWGDGSSQFMYSQEDEANICVDMCYYCRKAIREVNTKNKMMGPALSCMSSTLEYLEYMYQGIEKGCHPTGDNLPCSVDPDDYFDIIDIHPYVNVIASEYPDTAQKENEVVLCDQNYIDFNTKFYTIACAHGDSEKPHWYTETGCTDYGDLSKRDVIGRETAKQLEMIKKQLPWVECVIFYVLDDLYEFNVSTSENNFGIVTNPCNPDEPMKLKPIAISIYKFIHNGATYNEAEFEALRNKYVSEDLL